MKSREHFSRRFPGCPRATSPSPSTNPIARVFHSSMMENDGTPAFTIHLPIPDRFEPTTMIGNLEPNQRQLNLIAIVLRIQANPQKTREGHEIHSFKIADRSGSVTFNVWNTTGQLITPGDILRLQNCITQVFRNELCVKPGRNGIVTKVGEFLLDFNEEPDMSVLSPSILNEMNTGKDRLHPTKRPAQSMS